MNRARRRTFGALAASAALVFAAGAAILPAAADPPTEWVDAGTLSLTTGATDKVTYDATGATQPLSSLPASLNGCDLKDALTGSLLRFGGKVGSTAKNVGFLNDSIGVNEKLKDLCWKVDTLSTSGAETLDLSLNPALVNFAGRRLLARSASLDLEVRSYLGAKARIQATAWLDKTGSPSVQVGSAVELLQGSTACNVKDNENCRWTITPTGRFNRLSLKVIKGSFSLEGGSDTQTSPLQPTAPTTFALVSEVDKFIDCTEGTSLTEDNVTVTYIGTAGDAECEPFGVTLTAGDEEVGFKKPLSVTPNAEFIFDIDWTPTPTGTPEATLPQPEVDFEEGPGENPHLMPFCPPALYNTSGDLVGLEGGDPSSLPDWVAVLDGTQYACVGSRSADVGPTVVTIHDAIYLIGDAKMRLS